MRQVRAIIYDVQKLFKIFIKNYLTILVKNNIFFIVIDNIYLHDDKI